MGLTLVYLGEHHVLDVVAGAALASTAWAVAGWAFPTQQTAQRERQPSARFLPNRPMIAWRRPDESRAD
jgi:membrane-associated phospholipid phosphatase